MTRHEAQQMVEAAEARLAAATDEDARMAAMIALDDARWARCQASVAEMPVLSDSEKEERATRYAAMLRRTTMAAVSEIEE